MRWLWSDLIRNARSIIRHIFLILKECLDNNFNSVFQNKMQLKTCIVTHLSDNFINSRGWICLLKQCEEDWWVDNYILTLVILWKRTWISRTWIKWSNGILHHQLYVEIGANRRRHQWDTSNRTDPMKTRNSSLRSSLHKKILAMKKVWILMHMNQNSKHQSDTSVWMTNKRWPSEMF